MACQLGASTTGGNNGASAGGVSLLSRETGREARQDRYGKARYRCQNEECSHHSFLLNPAYKGRLPEIKQQIIEMSLNGSGVRDTARGHCQLNGSRPDMTTTYCGHDVFEYSILDHFTFS
jgi:hypothetical protein